MALTSETQHLDLSEQWIAGTIQCKEINQHCFKHYMQISFKSTEANYTQNVRYKRNIVLCGSKRINYLTWLIIKFSIKKIQFNKIKSLNKSRNSRLYLM
jgi:predicted esterase YcpF (UPF0227 family)